MGRDRRDRDGDGVDDCRDLCVGISDPAQADQDGDGRGDACDACPITPARGDVDRDQDGVPDSCDPEVDGDLAYEITIAELRRRLEAGASCVDVVQAHLDRIARYDFDPEAGPPINAFTRMRPGVLDRARALDAAWARGERGPLHCVPVAVKDLFQVEGLPLNGGSWALEGLVARSNATVVERLEAAGAVILGSTTMDELSKGGSGISGRGGKTGNPYDTDRNAGGSSSGSAAAVAASFAVGALGTDNCGSLLMPATFNGLVATRAGSGRVSLHGTLPSNRRDAIVGALTRTVADQIVMLRVISGPDPEDPMTLQTEPLKWGRLNRDAPSERRLGFVRSFGHGDWTTWTTRHSGAAHFAILGRQFADLRAAGHSVVESLSLPGVDLRRGSVAVRSDTEAFFEANRFEMGYAEFCSHPERAAFARRSHLFCLGRAFFSRYWRFEGSPFDHWLRGLLQTLLR